MKRNGGGREACLAEVFALIQIPPDIHSAMSCLFCGPQFSTQHTVQKRCPCVAFVVNTFLYYIDPLKAGDTKLCFQLDF